MYVKFKLVGVVGLILSHSIFADWFNQQTPLTKAHESILQGDMPSFWQTMHDVWNSETLDQSESWFNLLSVMYQRQCGRDLPIRLPLWLESLDIAIIQRDEPLRRYYRWEIEGYTKKYIRYIEIKGTNADLKLDNQVRQQKRSFYGESEEQVKSIYGGVYQITVATAQEHWQGSILLAPLHNIQWINWQGNNWQITEDVNNNKVSLICPPQEIKAVIMKPISYELVWHQRIKAQESYSLPKLQPGPYWYSVSFINHRFQGDIHIELQHRILKRLK
ncbi:DUF2861 family protein [Zooshikella harenae]|uniref:DUF2861 family protein n=1 Tax=Zooshikella harenae TaxID=2827238 RepID=A0ABS5ZG93_9GAMM|nr:DUF2861 family protein [Zooshikella harenae]MBU2712985.1 DUF2861 family protein [Zooshikella harenae]